MNRQVICEHPELILNRALIKFIREGGVCFTNDDGERIQTWHEFYTCQDIQDRTQRLLHRLAKAFYVQKNLIKQNRISIDSCYFINPVTGETCNIFVYVPCGHCLICKHKKRISFAYRCEAESQMHSAQPLFITLTYNNEYLPEDELLHYEHVQNFLKRLRIRLSREYGISQQSLRYACCGEYTPTTNRPHYHLIVWGMPYIEEAGKPALFDLIDKTWSKYDRHTRTYHHMGRTQVKVSNNAKGVGKYIGKYISKNSDAEQADGFLHSSTRNGGIGTPWINANKHYLLDNPDLLELKYTDKFTGKTKRMPLVKYFIDKTFPSVSRYIPQEVRYAFGDFCIGLGALDQIYYADALYDKVGKEKPQCLVKIHQKDEELRQRYIDYFNALDIQLPDSLFVSSSVHNAIDKETAIYMIETALVTLRKYCYRDYSDADYLADRRNLYYTQLFEYQKPVDIVAMVDKIKKELAKEKNKYKKC